jgi:hypothetical protein
MRRKVGDRVTIKSKYFNQFNDLEGTIESIDDHYHQFTVRLDDVEKLQVFEKEELKKISP